jgi:hypothetical protein
MFESRALRLNTKTDFRSKVPMFCRDGKGRLDPLGPESLVLALPK